MDKNIVSRQQVIDEIKHFQINIQGLRVGKGLVTDCLTQYRDLILARMEAIPATDSPCLGYCKDCKKLYFKDFNAYCPDRVSPCTPYGFCDKFDPREGTTK